MFADDSKLFRRLRKTSSLADQVALQQDLIRLQEWSRTWLLKFNENKCKVMHIGRSNPHYEYQLNDRTLEDTVVEKVLGVHVTPTGNQKSMLLK